jgi:CRP-like cAMP-binding protein
MQQLINYIETIIRVDQDARAALYDLARVERFAKNQYILEPGQYCSKIWFLNSGMVRKFHYFDGKEMTSWIYTENEIFTSLQSYAQDTQADEYLQACEKTEVISISKQNSQKLARFPQFVTFSTVLMEREFVNIDIHTREFNKRDAKGRYEYLRTIAPQVVGRAKLGHIASLIGVTQETLSRIRR